MLETLLLAQTGVAHPLGDLLSARWESAADRASTEKRTYTEKLESATGGDVFKYVLLINVSALEGFVAQTRLQAQQSFNLSRTMATVGFVLLSIAVASSIYLTYYGSKNLDAAYLAALAGLLTEFVSGVFFYLYNRALQQINLFHEKLISMQQTSLSFLAASLVVDDSSRDRIQTELAASLLNRSMTPTSSAPSSSTP